MADDDEDVIKNNPNLVELLKSRLPELGLDYETYGPYVYGTPEDDPDELDGVIQLLQASSEEYAENEQVWTKLLEDIQDALKKDNDHRKQQEQSKIESERHKMEEQLTKAKLEEKNKVEDSKGDKSSVVDNETKKLLMQRYAYEDGNEEGGGGTGGGGKGNKSNNNEEEVVLTNKQVAQQMSMEQAKMARSKKVQTKKDEQQKTKEQKLNKQQLKEERRKRTTKGERKGRG